MTVTIATFDRAEEKKLLGEWFETTNFDKISPGVPNVVDDAGEAEDGTKEMNVPGWEGSVGPFKNEHGKPHVYARDIHSGAGNCVCGDPMKSKLHVQAAPGVPVPDDKSFGYDLESKVRHVRTPAGERRYGQPVGSIIVRDRVLSNLTIMPSKYSGFTRVRDKKGNEYDVGKHDGKWIATRSGDWHPLATADNEDGIYEALDKHAGGGKTSVAPAPRKRSLPGKTPAVVAHSENNPHIKKVNSPYKAYEAYDGADGQRYYVARDPDTHEHVALDPKDNEIHADTSKAKLLAHLSERSAPKSNEAAPAKEPTPTPAPSTAKRPARSVDASNMTDKQKIAHAEEMYGTDRSKWPKRAQQDIAKIEGSQSGDGLDKMTVAQLRQHARDNGMSSVTRLTTKPALLAAIRKHRENQAAAADKPAPTPKAPTPKKTPQERAQAATHRRAAPSARPGAAPSNPTQSLSNTSDEATIRAAASKMTLDQLNEHLAARGPAGFEPQKFRSKKAAIDELVARSRSRRANDAILNGQRSEVERRAALTEADKRKRVLELANEMHNTADPRRVAQLQEQIRQLQPTGHLPTIGESAAGSRALTDSDKMRHAVAMYGSDESKWPKKIQQEAAALRARTGNPNSAAAHAAEARANTGGDDQAIKDVMSARSKVKRVEAYRRLTPEGIINLFSGDNKDRALVAFADANFGQNEFRHGHFEVAAENLRSGNWTPEQAAQSLEQWGRLATARDGNYYSLAARLLRGTATVNRRNSPEVVPKTESGRGITLDDLVDQARRNAGLKGPSKRELAARDWAAQQARSFERQRQELANEPIKARARAALDILGSMNIVGLQSEDGFLDTQFTRLRHPMITEETHNRVRESLSNRADKLDAEANRTHGPQVESLRNAAASYRSAARALGHQFDGGKEKSAADYTPAGSFVDNTLPEVRRDRADRAREILTRTRGARSEATFTYRQIQSLRNEDSSHQTIINDLIGQANKLERSLVRVDRSERPGIEQSIENYRDAVRILRGEDDLPSAKSYLMGEIKAFKSRSTKDDGEDEHTGAMVALIPSDDDLQRIYDPLGESLYELHVTLAYLGKASSISPDAQMDITSAVSYWSNRLSVVEAKAFSVNIFNPTGDEPCVVLGVGNGDSNLEDVHSNIWSAVKDAALQTNFSVPDQHTPWAPHITLRYFKQGEAIDMDWMKDQFEKLGPITFDKVRVVFAGKAVDFKLQESMEEPEPAVDGDQPYQKGMPKTCKYCGNPATKKVIHSGGVGSIAACDGHLSKAKRDAARSTKDGSVDWSNIDMVRNMKATVITPGGRVGDNARHNFSPRQNWVDKRGGLPEYIRIVRNGLIKHGHSEGQATALAVAAMKRWASGRGHVTPKVRAAAAAALAQWEAMKGSKALWDAFYLLTKADASYLNQRMAEGTAAAASATATVNHGNNNPDFNNKHPRGAGGKFGSKPGTGGSSHDTARTLSNALKKRLPMSYGQQGPVIQQLQVLLDKLGFGSTEEDGIFGDKTQAGVKAAQKRFGLDQTGQVDETLMTALLNAAHPSKRKTSSAKH